MIFKRLTYDDLISGKFSHQFDIIGESLIISHYMLSMGNTALWNEADKILILKPFELGNDGNDRIDINPHDIDMFIRMNFNKYSSHKSGICHEHYDEFIDLKHHIYVINRLSLLSGINITTKIMPVKITIGTLEYAALLVDTHQTSRLVIPVVLYNENGDEHAFMMVFDAFTDIPSKTTIDTGILYDLQLGLYFNPMGAPKFVMKRAITYSTEYLPKHELGECRFTYHMGKPCIVIQSNLPDTYFELNEKTLISWNDLYMGDCPFSISAPIFGTNRDELGKIWFIDFNINGPEKEPVNMKSRVRVKKIHIK